MKTYDHKKIEKKWQKEWENKKLYKTSESKGKKKFYVLDMFPYPSGAGLHVGHPRGYIGSDIYARMKRMAGFNVLHPMGYDAFGLPAEQYAIEHKIHPRKAVEKNIKTFRGQLDKIGFSYDWSRQVNTTDPEYYKWTQWIFLQIYNSYYDTEKNKARPISELIKKFEKTYKNWKKLGELEKEKILMNYRLAYEGYSEVNWCPKLGTVLANDEIVDDKDGNPVSERGGYPVEKKSMRQWFMRITAYADRLEKGLEDLNWSQHIKEIQKNWIGRSEGSEIEFSLKNSQEKIKVFTTRADTLFGVTYVVLAPEHKLVEELRPEIQNRNEVEAYILNLKNKPEADRTADNKEKTGIELQGVKAINPANGEEVPVWIADYVLAGYGTGAVMAVPAHDERDFLFAKKYHLPIKSVIEIKNKINIKQIVKGDSVGNSHLFPISFQYELSNVKDVFFYTQAGEDICDKNLGILINSGNFNGLTSEEARNKITEFVGGKIVTKYKMRDAIFARQRYWGEPIPLKHDKDGLIIPLKEKELPLKLPNVTSYEPTGTGESPLAGVKAWVKGGYETNTMPGWAGSSWYFLRYMDPKNKKALADKKNIKYWKDVDMYVGGQEHATGHLLYSRFWHKFLHDIGVVPTDEPFKTLKNQGLIMASDGRKMSKRWGNVVNPDDVVATYGADTLRVYEMFMGPFDQAVAWSTESIIGSRRFIEKVWRIEVKVAEGDIEFSRSGRAFSKGKKSKSEEIRGPENSKSPEAYKSFVTLLHKTVKKVTEDIESMSFNTAVSSMMILVNEMENVENLSLKDYKMFLQILAPFAPHMTEEIWRELGEKKSIHLSAWPKWDKKKLEDERIKIPVSVNGKVRAEIFVTKDMSEDEIKSEAQKDKAVIPWIEGKEIKRIIYVPNRILNIVV